MSIRRLSQYFVGICNNLQKRFNVYDSDGARFVAFTNYLALALAISIPISILTFNRVMHVGHPTPFPLSDVRSDWTLGPTTRGSLNIIWACVSTIFTCVYVSLHLNVPIWGSHPCPGFLDICKRSWKSTSRKGSWMIFNIFAPELVAFVAICEWLNAKELKKILMDENLVSGQFTSAHAFFADMGGFRVQEKENEAQAQNEENGGTPVPNDTILDGSLEEGKNPGQSNQYAVIRSGKDFYKWLKQSHIELDYERLRVEIEGVSRADSLLKTLTCIQATWLVVQTIVRHIEHLPVSPLEVTTCSYVMCTLITYALWWDKPYGVRTHILLHLSPIQGPRDQSTNPTPFNRTTGDKTMHKALALSGLVGAIIGAVHCSLWNATFVNSNGQLLWRICSIVQVVAPLMVPLLHALVHLAADVLGLSEFAFIIEFGSLIISLVAIFVHFCARILLFILVGYSFWSMPEGVYKDIDWSWVPRLF